MFEKQLGEDGNLGLAKTLVVKVQQQKVKSLGDVYITLGFDEIVQKSGIQNLDVEKFLL